MIHITSVVWAAVFAVAHTHSWHAAMEVCWVTECIHGSAELQPCQSVELQVSFRGNVNACQCKSAESLDAVSQKKKFLFTWMESQSAWTHLCSFAHLCCRLCFICVWIVNNMCSVFGCPPDFEVCLQKYNMQPISSDCNCEQIALTSTNAAAWPLMWSLTCSLFLDLTLCKATCLRVCCLQRLLWWSRWFT